MSNQACVEQTKEEKEQDLNQQIRANSYMLLASLLVRAPDTEMLQQLRGIEADKDDPKDIVNAWCMLRLAAERHQSEAVADEFHTLFIGIGRGELLPFASWYLTGFLMEKPLAHLRKRLKGLGYERQDDVKEPEDHVAALCEVMGHLILDEEIPFEVEQDFYQHFIGNWMHRFFNDLQGSDTAGFYRAVGQLGESFLDIEKKYFSMMV